MIGEELFLEASKFLFWIGGLLGGGGRFLEETRGIEEEDKVDYVDMISYSYEHHDPTVGAKLF